MPEHNPGQMGGTMRLGKRRTIFKTPSSILRKDPSRSHITPARPACLTRSPSCFPGKLYGDTEYVEERHRHRFEVGVVPPPTRAIGSALHVSSAQVNPELKSHFEDRGFRFVGQDVEGERMEVTELDGTDRHVNTPPPSQVTTTCLLTCDPPLLLSSEHPYFVGVQYHPEFTSRPIKPSPPYLGLLLASAGKLQSYLQKGCRLSPR